EEAQPSYGNKSVFRVRHPRFPELRTAADVDRKAPRSEHTGAHGAQKTGLIFCSYNVRAGPRREQRADGANGFDSTAVYPAMHQAERLQMFGTNRPLQDDLVMTKSYEAHTHGCGPPAMPALDWEQLLDLLRGSGFARGHTLNFRAEATRGARAKLRAELSG